MHHLAAPPLPLHFNLPDSKDVPAHGHLGMVMLCTLDYDLACVTPQCMRGGLSGALVSIGVQMCRSRRRDVISDSVLLAH